MAEKPDDKNDKQFVDVNKLLEEIGVNICRGRNTKVFKKLYTTNCKVNVTEFHEKCDSKGPTVTLLYGRYNTMFGGYTSQNWLSTDKPIRKTDADAFLFYKNSGHGAKCCFMPIKKGKEGKAITCHAKFGPTFGGSSNDTYDLQVFKQSSKGQTKSKDKYMDLNGMLKIGKSYEVSNPKETKTEINSGKLEVLCVEVYQVSDDELDYIFGEDPKDFDEMKVELTAMEPHLRLDMKQYNILLVGAIGTGKSSFCNTLASVFSEEKTHVAVVGSSKKSVTNTKKGYILKTKDGKAVKIRITDIRGIDYDSGLEHEIHHILDGRLSDEYKFSDHPESLRKSQLKVATLNEEIHLVCFVTSLNSITANLCEHFEYVKQKIADKGLPSSVIVTKLDEECSHVAEDVDHIYKCAKALDAVKLAAEFFGIPQDQVFPVVNYSKQTKTERGIDRLALHALYKMYCLMHDHLENHEALSKPVKAWESREQIIYVRQKSRMELNKELSKFNEEFRILCFGPSRSGKSSFIDSVLSTFRNKICSEATRGYTDESSATTMFQLYQIKYVNEAGVTQRSNVFLADMPGIQEEGGVQLRDAKLIVMGHVVNKSEIQNGVKRIVKKPRPRDRIHCICFVFDLSAVDELSHSTFLKMCCEFKTWLSKRRVPFVVVVTKCDKVSERFRQNPARVFEDTQIEEYKDKLVELFNVRENKIFPVQNYVDECTTVKKIEVLLLDVIREVLSFENEPLDSMEMDQEPEDKDDDKASDFLTDYKF